MRPAKSCRRSGERFVGGDEALERGGDVLAPRAAAREVGLGYGGRQEGLGEARAARPGERFSHRKNS